MSWLKIDDQIPRHRKIVQIEGGAAWLWICSIAYAQSQYTDGFISNAVIGHLGPPKHIASKLLKQLLAVGLWERVEGGYQVHDYLKHNASAAQRKREARLKSRAGRLGGQSTQSRRREGLNTEANDKRRPKQSARKNSSTLRSPLHSTPLRSDVQAAAPAARSAGVSTTAGNDPKQPRRDVPDGGPSAPASTPVEPPTATTVEEAQAEYDADPRAYHQKYGRHR